MTIRMVALRDGAIGTIQRALRVYMHTEREAMNREQKKAAASGKQRDVLHAADVTRQVTGRLEAISVVLDELRTKPGPAVSNSRLAAVATLRGSGGEKDWESPVHAFDGSLSVDEVRERFRNHYQGTEVTALRFLNAEQFRNAPNLE